jgi:type I restriction enzyme S subunit
LIPVDWGDVADFLDGRRRPVKDSERAKVQGDIPYYGASGIVDYVNSFLFDEDLILLGEDGENILSRNCRLVFKISGKTWVNNHAHVLRPKLGMALDYLVEFLESRDYAQYNTGTAQPKLNKQVCSGIPVLCPPLPEQRAIATALSDVDALLGGLERLIAKKRDLKQAAMQQLLTGQTRLPGFSGEWEVKRLGDLGATYGGLTGKTKADFGEGAARYITFMNVMTNVLIDCGIFDRVNVSPVESQNRAKKGDLFFNGSSETPEEVAMCAVLLEDVQDVYLNSFCFGFRFGEGAEADGVFFAYYFRSTEGRELMKSLAQGSTRYNLSKVALLNSPLRLPTRPEQTAIAAVLSDMDAELSALEARRDKTRALKQGMMQELLTGRVRLISGQLKVESGE